MVKGKERDSFSVKGEEKKKISAAMHGKETWFKSTNPALSMCACFKCVKGVGCILLSSAFMLLFNNPPRLLSVAAH